MTAIANHDVFTWAQVEAALIELGWAKTGVIRDLRMQLGADPLELSRARLIARYRTEGGPEAAALLERFLRCGDVTAGVGWQEDALALRDWLNALPEAEYDEDDWSDIVSAVIVLDELIPQEG